MAMRPAATKTILGVGAVLIGAPLACKPMAPGPMTAPRGGAEPAEVRYLGDGEEFRKSRELATASGAVRARTAEQDRVAADHLLGRLTLDEAAGQFREIHRGGTDPL